MKSLLTSAGLVATFFIGGLALGQTGPPKPPPPKRPFPMCSQTGTQNCGYLPGLGDCYQCCDSLCDVNTNGHQYCLEACDDVY